MVSPMREKRTWPPQDKDSDGETVAAFEAAVAVVKETVVRSGEVLVSAKEDLNDHQRWLKAQTAKSFDEEAAQYAAMAKVHRDLAKSAK